MLIIYFNLPFVLLSQYQKNILASGWYEKISQHRDMVNFFKKI